MNLLRVITAYSGDCWSQLAADCYSTDAAGNTSPPSVTQICDYRWLFVDEYWIEHTIMCDVSHSTLKSVKRQVLECNPESYGNSNDS